MARRALPVVAWLCLVAPLSAQSPVAIRLHDAPDHVSYPVPAGRNLLVTAEIAGGAVETVWLAIAASARERVALQRAGPGRYQINLASAAVRDLLERSGMRGEFAIHARAADGAVTSSVPLRYTFVWSQPNLATYYVYANDSFDSVVADPELRPWFDAATATRVEWYFGDGQRTAPVEAVAGGERWPLMIDGKRRRATLVVTAQVREVWEARGELAIHTTGGAAAILRARPSRLRLQDAGRFTVGQRKEVVVPGSRGWLRVSLDDITAGQVRLGIRTVERRTVVAPRSVKQGDTVAFRIGERDYALRVVRLVNLLIGDDFAELQVEAGHAESPTVEIERLLVHIGRAPITFIREGQRYPNAEAEAHIRRKYERVRDEVRAADDFIDKVASRSSTTGRAYLVELPDGTQRPAAAWLRDVLREQRGR